eukprot:7195911-Prymnesium_polylepis.1
MELLKRGIYANIAVALKGGEWRKTSMPMLAKAFAGSDAVGKEDANDSSSRRLRRCPKRCSRSSTGCRHRGQPPRALRVEAQLRRPPASISAECVCP